MIAAITTIIAKKSRAIVALTGFHLIFTIAKIAETELKSFSLSDRCDRYDGSDHIETGQRTGHPTFLAVIVAIALNTF